MHYRIALGADHRGYELKNLIKEFANIGEHRTEWIDLGTDTPERTDYPIYAIKVVKALKNKEADLGIMLCGSGIGMAIVANRYPGIYSGVVWNESVARSARTDDNVNILSLPADYLKFHEIPDIIQAWLSAEFKGGRYQQRLVLADRIE